MKAYFFFAAFLVSALAFSQPANSNYCPKGLFFPDKVNSPGIHKKSDLKLNLSFKFNFNESDNHELLSPGKLIFNPVAEVAYSPIEHFYVMAAYRSLQNREVYDEQLTQDYYTSATPNNNSFFGGNTNVSRYTGNQGELGIGYYTKPGNKTILEAATGYGFGNVSRNGDVIVVIDYDYNTGNTSSNNYSLDFDTRYNNYFLQGSFGYIFKAGCIKAGVKGSYRDFTEMKYKNPGVETYLKGNYVSRAVENNDYGFIQPYIDLEVGGRVAKYNIQAGVSDQITDWSVAGNIKAYVCMGLSLNFFPDKKQ